MIVDLIDMPAGILPLQRKLLHLFSAICSDLYSSLLTDRMQFKKYP